MDGLYNFKVNSPPTDPAAKLPPRGPPVGSFTKRLIRFNKDRGRQPTPRRTTMTDLSRYGPWAVIAGGSEGVGAEFAKQLADDGFNLVLIARKPGPLDDTARLCREIGAQVRTLA